MANSILDMLKCRFKYTPIVLKKKKIKLKQTHQPSTPSALDSTGVIENDIAKRLVDDPPSQPTTANLVPKTNTPAGTGPPSPPATPVDLLNQMRGELQAHGLELQPQKDNPDANIHPAFRGLAEIPDLPDFPELLLPVACDGKCLLFYLLHLRKLTLL